MLGLGRALGETMAVAMVLSASGVVTFNLISLTNPATIAANIALNFPEATRRRGQRADRHRPGAVRDHLRGQLRGPLRSSPAASGSQLMTHAPPTTAAREPRSTCRWPRPRLPALGAGAGRRRRASPRAAAWSALAARLGLVGHASSGRRRALHRRRCRSGRASSRAAARPRTGWSTALVWTAFVLALVPLVSLLWTVVAKGVAGDRRRVPHLLDAQRRRRRAAASTTRSSAPC